MKLTTIAEFDSARSVPVASLPLGSRIVVDGRDATIVQIRGVHLVRFETDFSVPVVRPQDGRIYPVSRSAKATWRSVVG
jgi:hypothetical protein